MVSTVRGRSYRSREVEVQGLRTRVCVLLKEAKDTMLGGTYRDQAELQGAARSSARPCRISASKALGVGTDSQDLVLRSSGG